ncbi:MAG: tetratricopeptide repeat protein [Bacteroidetes bacterium]|nr:tetratricopeptide repeat protein [Bacteroidota bacterium]
MKFRRYQIIICLLIILSANSCNRNIDHSGSNNQETILVLADSLKHSKPVEADSLYRIILATNADNKSKIRIQALIGLSKILTSLSKYDTAIELINQAKSASFSIADTSLQTSIFLAEGNLYLDLSDYPKAESAFKSGLEMAKNAGREADQNLFTLSLGSLQKEMGQYAEAIRTFTESVKLSEQSGNTHNQALALEKIGLTLMNTGDYDGARPYLNRAINLNRESNLRREYAMGLMNLGILYRQMGKLDSSLIFYNKAGREFLQMNDSINLLKIKYNTGIVLKNQGEYETARNLMEEVLAICRKKGMLDGEVYALHTLASLYNEEGKIEKGLMFSDSAIVMARKREMTRVLSQFLKQKEEFLANAGKYREAYSLALEGIAFSDSLLSIETRNEIARLKTRFETEQKESENIILRQSLQIQHSKMIWLRIIIIMLILSVLLVLIIYRYSIRSQKQLRLLAEEKALREAQVARNSELELKKSQLETELKEARIGELEYKARIKEQELVYQSLMRIDLTNTNRSVREKLLPFTLKFTRKKDQEEYIRILNEITREAARDTLSEFEQTFNQLHPSFMEKLMAYSPDLNRSEINICSLIRLNLTTKDIANLLNLSISTVETTRHNIRKKLKLDNSESLTAFLIMI